MSRFCAKTVADKQFPKQDAAHRLSEWRKRLQLLEGEKKANYEEGEQEKKKNDAMIKKLKKELQELKDQKTNFGKNELLMREALEGRATGSDAHQKVEPAEVLDNKVDRLGDLTNQLNRLRATTAKKRQKLAAVMIAFKEAVVDNIEYEENRQPEAEHVRQLNNQIDCVSKKLLEAQHVRDKYLSVISSLTNEQTTYASRLELLREQLAESERSQASVEQAQQYARSVWQSAQHQLEDSQQLASQWRQERDSVLAVHKRRAEDQRAEYQQLRRQLFLGGPDNPLPPEPTPSEYQAARRVSHLVDVQLPGLYRQSKQLIEVLGARSIEDVVRLFEMQADTSRQLTMVWKDAENNISRLKKRKQEAELEIERLRYADNMQEMRDRDRCLELRETINSNLTRKRVIETMTDEVRRSLGSLRAGLVNMLELFQNAGVSVMSLDVADKNSPPGLGELFDAVTAAVRFLMEHMESINVSEMISEMDSEDFFASKSEQLALETKVRGVPPVQPPGKQRFSFLMLDRPDVIDEGPSVPTRAQMKRHSQVMVEARTRKIRAPTARDLRKTRRRSTIVDRPLQAMT